MTDTFDAGPIARLSKPATIFDSAPIARLRKRPATIVDSAQQHEQPTPTGDAAQQYEQPAPTFDSAPPKRKPPTPKTRPQPGDMRLGKSAQANGTTLLPGVDG